VKYAEYLKSDHWQYVRKVALERAGNRCQVCAAEDALQVHHNNYYNRGDESLFDVVVLCSRCHEVIHQAGIVTDLRKEIEDDQSIRGPELIAMLAAVANRAAYEHVRSHLSPDDIEDGRAREVLFALEESYREGDTSLDGVLSRIKDKDVAAAVVAGVASGEFESNDCRFIKHIVSALQMRSIQRRRANVGLAIKEGEQAGADYVSVIRPLIEEKMFLDAAIAKLHEAERE